MPNNRFSVGITAYTIFQNSGLSHFLFQAIKALSLTRPAWSWNVIGSIALPELAKLDISNVNIDYWDGDGATRFISNIGNIILRIAGKKNDAPYLLQSRSEKYKLHWGNYLKRIKSLQSVDAIWIPNYDVTLNRISLFNDCQDIKKPILFTIHDIHPIFFPGDHSPENIARFYNGFIPLAYKSNKIITHSHYQKSVISSYLGLDNEKIGVTPQPPLINPQLLLNLVDGNNGIKVLARFGINKPFAFYPASTTHTHKNHIRLLLAWSLLYQRYGSECPILVCTGKGNRRQWQYLNSLIRALGINNKVIFTGLINTSTLSILYDQCEFIIIPTLYEGAGSGILTDALTVGKPVFCADIPQIREQLDSMGIVSVAFFDPYNVNEIVKSVTNYLEHKDDLINRSAQNKINAQARFDEMWQIWAEYYCNALEQMPK